MISVVTAFAPIKFDVVLFKLQSRIHLLVRQGPIAMFVIQIVGPVLKINSNRLLVGFSNNARVSIAIANVGEAADMAKDFSKLVRSLPSDSERADSAAAGATDRAATGIIGDVVVLFDFGQNFVEQKFRVVIAERIVFDASVFGFRLPTGFFGQFLFVVPGVNEHADRDRKLFTMNQVVENDRNAVVAILADVGMTVLKNHQSCWFGFVILLWYVDVVAAFGSRENFALEPLVFSDCALRYTFNALRIGPQLVATWLFLGRT